MLEESNNDESFGDKNYYKDSPEIMEDARNFPYVKGILSTKVSIGRFYYC